MEDKRLVMKRSLRIWASIVAWAIISACSHSPIALLDDGVGHLTQDDVIGRLGFPQASTKGPNGDIWAYRHIGYSALQRVGLALEGFGAGYHGQTPMAVANPPAPANCTEYILFFNAERVLRLWQQHDC
jgi:hypothetical protein